MESSARVILLAVVLALATLAACESSTSRAHASHAASEPATCARDAECEIVRHEPSASTPCCTCATIAATRAEATAIADRCRALAQAKPDAGPLGDLCVLSCLQSPRLRATCKSDRCVTTD